MDTPFTAEEREALFANLAKAREVLDALVGDLRAVDRELDDLGGAREQHRLLRDACGALEALGELGGADLFWGERADAGGESLRRARGRLDAFEKQVAEIEERRQGVLDQIDRQQERADGLEWDVADALDEEERRQQEWVIQRELGALPDAALIMPWARGGEEDRRFRKNLAGTLLVALLIALISPWIRLPLPEPEARPEVPERVARMMMESRKLPPPPPQAVPSPVKPEQTVAEQSPPAKSKPKEGPGEGAGVGPAKGPDAGLLAFREKISGMAENQNLSRLGAQARILSPGAASGPVTRSMVTTQAPGSSGGINLAALSRNVGGGGGGGAGMAGVQIARATSTIGGGGGARAGTGKGTGGPPPGRTDEEIQIVFDRHKSALYRLYNRELREDPTLKGQMVLRIRIEPDGSVTLCELQATDMRAPQLVAQVVDRVRTFDFGAKDVPAITILYPIDFLPAT